MKLTNNEVLAAKGALAELSKVKLPLKASMAVARLEIKLNAPIEVFSKVRDGLFAKYEVKQGRTEGGQVELTSEQEGAIPKFSEEFAELLGMETEELAFEKVRLPEKVASTCGKCGEQTERGFEIEPSILVALEKFVEIA